MNKLFKTLTLFMIVSLVLISCGAPGAKPAGADVNYKQTMSEIKSLTDELSGNEDEIAAKRYLAKVEKLLQPAIAKGGEKGLTIVPVSTRPVKAEYIAQKVQYLGDISGDPSVIVYPKLTDIVTDIKVKNGDYVKKGAVLGIISDATVRAAKAQAEAAYFSAKSQVANVKVEYERMKTLYDAQAISESQWDQIVTQKDVAEAGLKQAKAALDMASTQLGYATITAPISGYVSNLAYRVGDMSTPQKPFVTVHQIKTVKIDINVTEYDLGYIAEGQRTEISVSTYPGEIFDGYVKTVSPVIDPMTRTARIEILADNQDGRLKPGMFARVNIITHERDNALTVDKAATLKQTVLKPTSDNLREDRVVEAHTCFVVRDGVAIEVPLEIGIESKTKFEVLKGLEAGDLVVVMGQNNLSDSTLVNVVE